ncbi:MAG: hypothetical protein R3F36_12900 [Candidatus Competibacteraceae bacterium]
MRLVTGWHDPFTYTQDAFARTTVEWSLTDRKATGTERLEPCLAENIRVRFLALLLMIIPAATCERFGFTVRVRGGQWTKVCGALCLFAADAGPVLWFIDSARSAQTGAESSVELEYEERAGSLQRFFAATYTHQYLHPIGALRLQAYGYTVFTAQGLRELDTGSKCAAGEPGKSTVIAAGTSFLHFRAQGLGATCDGEARSVPRVSVSRQARGEGYKVKKILAAGFLAAFLPAGAMLRQSMWRMESGMLKIKAYVKKRAARKAGLLTSAPWSGAVSMVMRRGCLRCLCKS